MLGTNAHRLRSTSRPRLSAPCDRPDRMAGFRLAPSTPFAASCRACRTFAQSRKHPQSRRPRKHAPAAVLSTISLQRGDGGAGKLILKFSGDGAMPDMKTQGSQIVVDVGNASLPSALQRPLNVTDFATPVQRVDVKQNAAGAQVVLSTNGNFEPLAYQTGREYIVEIVPRAATATALSAPQAARRRRLPATSASALEEKLTYRSAGSRSLQDGRCAPAA